MIYQKQLEGQVVLVQQVNDFKVKQSSNRKVFTSDNFKRHWFFRSKKDIGFDSDFNEVTIYYKDNLNKKERLSLKKKSEISDEIVDRIVTQIN